MKKIPSRHFHFEGSSTGMSNIKKALPDPCEFQLIAESKLKKMGIEAAEALIKILYQEIASLNNQKNALQLQILLLTEQKSKKEAHLKRQIAVLQNHLKQTIQAKQNPNCSIQPRKNPSFIAPQPKLKKKIPYSPVKNIIFSDTTSFIQSPLLSNTSVCQNIVETLMFSQIEQILVDFQDINALIKEQTRNFVSCKLQHQQTFHQAEQLAFSQIKISQQNQKFEGSANKYQLSAKKYFSTEKQLEQQICPKSLIRQYESIIQQYKQYSAFLKAHLCSCISFLADQTEKLVTNKTVHLHHSRCKDFDQTDYLSTDRSNSCENFPSNQLFDVIIRDISKVIEQKFLIGEGVRKQLQHQNKQLRLILDELIENLKQSGIYPNQSNHHDPLLKKNHSQKQNCSNFKNAPSQKSNKLITLQEKSLTNDFPFNSGAKQILACK